MLKIFHSDLDREGEKRREEQGGERKRETDGSSRGNAGKTQSRHKSWDIDSTANFPRSLAARRIGDSSCDAAITSLAGIKIQLYIKLSYIAPYLYLSHWYFLRFLPSPPRATLDPFLSVILVTPRCYGHHTRGTHTRTRGVPEASVMLTTDDDFIALVSVVTICLYTNYRRICHQN